MKKNFKDLFNLTNRTAVVTGGLGILGKKFIEGLASCGANLAIVDLDEKLCSEYSDFVKEQYKINCIAVGCDVSIPSNVDKAVNRIEKELGSIDILLNNAATKGKNIEDFFKNLSDYKLETWREVMSVNLDGMFLFAQAAGSLMAKRKFGSIIQISSIYGPDMAPDQDIYLDSHYLGMPINTPAVYSASKGGVIGLTKYLAAYWGKDNVRVNSISPGGILSGQNEQFINNYSKRVPMKRMANAEEMIGASIFLASDASSYITGQNIYIDGGLSSW